jgi:hypothetical protein
MGLRRRFAHYSPATTEPHHLTPVQKNTPATPTSERSVKKRLIESK